MAEDIQLEAKRKDFRAMYEFMGLKSNPLWDLDAIVINVFANFDLRSIDRDSELMPLVSAKAPIQSSLFGFEKAVADVLEDLVKRGILSPGADIRQGLVKMYYYRLSGPYVTFVNQLDSFSDVPFRFKSLG